MANHPNRGWRSRWLVDIAAATATHREGWLFKISRGDNGINSELVSGPELPEHLAARVTREAGEIYAEALDSVSGKRPVGRPAEISGKRVQVYLDAASLDAAAKLGNGNVSEGIRTALLQRSSK